MVHHGRAGGASVTVVTSQSCILAVKVATQSYTQDKTAKSCARMHTHTHTRVQVHMKNGDDGSRVQGTLRAIFATSCESIMISK